MMQDDEAVVNQICDAENLGTASGADVYKVDDLGGYCMFA